MELHYFIKFSQKLGHSQAETVRKIHQVFRDDAMSVTQIKVGYNRFKDGRTSVKSDERTRRPSTCGNDVVIEEVRTLIMAHRRLTVREIDDELGISEDSAHAILGMYRVAAKLALRLLPEEQKQVRLDTARDLLQTADENPECLNTVITGDERLPISKPRRHHAERDRSADRRI